MNVSDFYILAGSAMVGNNSSNMMTFAGGVVASLGINMQFETTTLSMTWICLLSATGFAVGYLMQPKE